MWVDIIIHTNNNIIKFNDCLPIHDFMNGKHFNNTGNLGSIDRNFKTVIYLLGSWQESFSQYMRVGYQTFVTDNLEKFNQG